MNIYYLKKSVIVLSAVTGALFCGCNAEKGGGQSNADDNSSRLVSTPSPNPNPSSTPNPSPSPTFTPSPTPSPSTSPSLRGRLEPYQTAALVFAGAGVWADELRSIEQIFAEQVTTYHEVSMSELNAMSVDDIAKYGVIVWPGGNGSQQVSGLTSLTKANLREAVQERGVSWIGFCAGAFIAVSPVGVVPGPILDYYYLENQGVSSAMVETVWADGSKHDLVWYGGPITPDGAGEVIARYPDGNAAISELWSGRGLVILLGPHPAVPQSTRDYFGLQDKDGLDFGVAWDLLKASIDQKPLAAF